MALQPVESVYGVRSSLGRTPIFRGLGPLQLAALAPSDITLMPPPVECDDFR